MPRVLESNLNLIPANRSELLLHPYSVLRLSASGLVDLAEDSGFGGLDLQPVRSVAYRQWLRAGDAASLAEALSPEDYHKETVADQRVRHMVASTFALQEGWRGVPISQPRQGTTYERRDLRETEDSRIYGLLLRAFFPQGGEPSLQRMHRTPKALGLDQQMSQIIYGDPAGDRDKDKATAAQYPNPMIQFNVDIAANWGVDSPEALVNELGERGGLKVLVDSFQMTRLGKAVNARLGTRRFIEPLLQHGLVGGVAISFCRDDFAKVDPDRVRFSYREGEAFVHGEDLPRDRGEHDLATILDLLREYGWIGNITLKAAVGKLITPTSPEWISRQEIVNIRRPIVARIKEEMSHVDPSDWLSMPLISRPPQS